MKNVINNTHLAKTGSRNNNNASGIKEAASIVRIWCCFSCFCCLYCFLRQVNTWKKIHCSFCFVAGYALQAVKRVFQCLSNLKAKVSYTIFFIYAKYLPMGLHNGECFARAYVFPSNMNQTIQTYGHLQVGLTLTTIPTLGLLSRTSRWHAKIVRKVRSCLLNK